MIAAGYPLWSDVWIRSGWRVQMRDRAYRLLDARDRIVCRGRRDECTGLGRALAPRRARTRAAILLHGLAGSRGAMSVLAAALERRGWATASLGYASFTAPFAAHVRAVRAVAEALAEDGADEIDLVGHSLGGLVARAAMAASWPAGRCVLIGVPNQGSARAEQVGRTPVGRRALGPSAALLMPGGARSLPVPSVPILVVAGGTERRGWNPLIRGDNDFTIAVAETRLGAAESRFVHVKCVHAFLPSHPATVAATLAFLADPLPQPLARRTGGES